MSGSAIRVVQGWVRAINDHDARAVAECFATDYEDAAPARKGEAVRGREEVRQNFERLFKDIPDIRAELDGVIAEGDTVWMEWGMHGTRVDGAPFDFVGVNIFEVRDDVFLRGRIYTELVRDAGGIEGQIDRMGTAAHLDVR